MTDIARSHRWLAFVALAALTAALPSRARAQSVDDFEDRSYSDGTYTLPYRLFVPADYDPDQAYPIVLFLHGSGERGTDNRLQLTGQTAPLMSTIDEIGKSGGTGFLARRPLRRPGKAVLLTWGVTHVEPPAATRFSRVS